jgi:hypothetical protein
MMMMMMRKKKYTGIQRYANFMSSLFGRATYVFFRTKSVKCVISYRNTSTDFESQICVATLSIVLDTGSVSLGGA